MDDETKSLSPALLAQAFPSNLEKSALKACEDLFENSVPGSADWRQRFSVKMANEQVFIPTRVYFEPIPSTRDLLSEDEKLIQQCIWTRHHIGYQRQLALAEIISANRVWTIPYIIFLIGEYVIEILDDIYANLGKIDEQKLADFLEKNPKFHELTRQRVISYWNEYYRHQYNRSDYVGTKIMSFLNDVLMSQKNKFLSKMN